MPNSALLVSIGQTAKILNVSIQTLRRWEQKGLLIPERSAGGTRLYNLEQVKKLKGLSLGKVKLSELPNLVEQSIPQSPLPQVEEPTYKPNYSLHYEKSDFPSAIKQLSKGNLNFPTINTSIDKIAKPGLSLAKFIQGAGILGGVLTLATSAIIIGNLLIQNNPLKQ